MAFAELERRLVERDKAEIDAGFLDRGLRGRNGVGIEGAVFVEKHTGAENEVAGIPEIPVRDVTLGGLRIRLFDETLDCEHIFSERRGRADIAVFGRRAIRAHAEGDDLSIRRGVRSALACGDKARCVGHDMIGGKRDHDRIVAALKREGRAGRDRRSGIAPRRLEQDIGLDLHLGELLGNDEAILPVGDHDRAAEHGRIGDALERFLERRELAEQREKLLRPALARSRPQPRPGAAAHDQRYDLLSHVRPYDTRGTT